MRWLFLLAALAAAVSFGCGPSLPTEAPPPSIEIGTGTDSFIPILDGEDIELIAGPQGGWHIEAAIRFQSVDPNSLKLTYEIHEPDQTLILNFAAIRLLDSGLVKREGEFYVRAGDIVILRIQTPAEIVGKEVEFDLTAEPQSGTVLKDRRRLIIVDNIDERA